MKRTLGLNFCASLSKHSHGDFCSALLPRIGKTIEAPALIAAPCDELIEPVEHIVDALKSDTGLQSCYEQLACFDVLLIPEN